jgi:hypothetical protein
MWEEQMRPIAETKSGAFLHGYLLGWMTALAVVGLAFMAMHH